MSDFMRGPCLLLCPHQGPCWEFGMCRWKKGKKPKMATIPCFTITIIIIIVTSSSSSNSTTTTSEAHPLASVPGMYPVCAWAEKLPLCADIIVE